MAVSYLDKLGLAHFWSKLKHFFISNKPLEVTDNTPYRIRRTGGDTDIGTGTREYKKLVGVTVLWNQYLSSQHLPSDSALYGADTYSANNVTFAKQSDGGYLLSTTSDGATADTSVKIGTSSTIPTLRNSGHIFYFALSGSPTESQCRINYANYNVPKYSIERRSTSTGFNMWLKVMSGTIITTAQKVYPMLIDLTDLFGSAIADHVYSLERSVTGSGVAYVKKFLEKDYYPYCTPTLKSIAGLASHDITGANILGGLSLGQAIVDAVNYPANTHLGSDDDGDFVQFTAGAVLTGKCFTTGIRFKENTQYTFIYTIKKGSSTSLATNLNVQYTDGSAQTLTGLKTPANVKQTIAFTTAVGKTVKGFITGYYGSTSYLYYDKSGIFEGVRTVVDFEQYVKHSYPLDSNVTLRGLLKLNNGDIYADGDTYEPNGTVTRRYGVHVFTGTESFTKISAKTEGWSVFAYTPSPTAITAAAGICDICDVGDVISYADFSSENLNRRLVTHYGNGIRFALPFTDVADARAALTGKTLVYKLATPAAETADSFAALQICDPYGIESFAMASDADGAEILVGHETRYACNLSNKLHSLPELADGGDGNYVIKQTGANMALQPLSSSLATVATSGSYNDLADKPTIPGAITLLDVYPVGSIYMSINNTDPGTLFGGTWEQLKDRFLLAAGDTYSGGDTGGSEEVTLTANQSGLPAHKHGFSTTGYSFVVPDGTQVTRGSNATGSVQNVLHSTNAVSLASIANNAAANAAEAHENMPPYLAVYMWKRTA